MDNRLLNSKKGILLLTVFLVAIISLGLVWAKKRYLMSEIHRWHGFLSSSQNLMELGEGGMAKNLRLYDPMGIEEDRHGNVYISDRGRGSKGSVIWKIDIQGRAHALAGSGLRGVPSNGDRALGSNLGSTQGLCIDSLDRLNFVDSVNHSVFRIDGDGRLVRIAGSKVRGYGGDGGPAVKARMNTPHDIRVDSRDNLYIADVQNHRIRKITPEGVISTVAGTGEPGYIGDGGPAVVAQLNTPYGVFIDKQDRLLIADSENHVLRRVDQNGIITTIGGVGLPGYAGSVQQARFNSPQSLFLDGDNNLFVNDEHNHAIRVIQSDGLISTFVGTGEAGIAEDGQSAIRAQLNDPENLIVRGDKSVLITEGDNARMLLVKVDRSVRSFAGSSLIDSY